jgi:hypothetical protein
MSFAREGRKVALVEKDRVGGTCLNYGCRPTKALRKSAEVAHLARQAADYGVNVGKVEVDFAAVMARKNRIIGGMQDGYDAFIGKVEGLDLYRGKGAFTGREGDTYRVEVGGETLQASEVYINVGVRAFIPPIDGIDGVPYLTERGVLALDDLPRHLIVIGAGYIGLEFAQMFRRFGSEVTIVETKSRLMPRQDEDVCGSVTEIFQNEGLNVITAATVRGPRSVAVIYCYRPGGCPTRTTWGWKVSAWQRTNAVSFPSTVDWPRSCPVSGRWATSMDAVLSPTRPTRSMKSSPPIAKAARAAWTTASSLPCCSSIRLSVMSVSRKWKRKRAASTCW